MIALDDNGNFIETANGLLSVTAYPEIQNAKSECRCNSGEWEADPLYGKNIIIWELTSSKTDMANDIFRICKKYFDVKTVVWNSEKAKFTIR